MLGRSCITLIPMDNDFIALLLNDPILYNCFLRSKISSMIVFEICISKYVVHVHGISSGYFCAWELKVVVINLSHVNICFKYFTIDLNLAHLN